jgi:hypothetical protein
VTPAWAGRLRWPVVVLAVAEAGWMVYDGTRALVVGDYVTPTSGAYAGRLGPWADLVAAIGIDPQGPFTKIAFVAYGVVWLGAVVAFIRRCRLAWIAMMIAAICSLWYLVIGTATSLVVIALLMVPAVRRGPDRADASTASG